MFCKWVVRPGTNNTYWAYTPCQKGFNYLSRVSKKEDIKPFYDNRSCPICGKKIKCDLYLVSEG